MNEADLYALLCRARSRLRLQGAVRVALVTLGLLFGISAAVVLLLRWNGVATLAGFWVLAAALLLILVPILAFLSRRLNLVTVATLLDERAQTHAHLTTWLSLRDRTETDSVRAGFKSAQAEAACRLGGTLRVADVLPWQMPVWHRAVWLAAILFLSALLMPARQIVDDAQTASRAQRTTAAAGAASSTSGDAAQSERNATRVQVLSPAQLRKLQLVATDNDLPAPLKVRALRELLDAIGGIPESALTDDVRQILDMLRRDTRTQAAAKNTSGTQTAGTTPPNANAATIVRPAAFDPLTATEQARAVVTSHFPDVQPELLRYYEKLRK